MTCQVCGSEFMGASCACGWGSGERDAVAIAGGRATYRPLPQGITKGQFGEPLYAAISLCAGIEQLRCYRHLPPDRATPHQRQRWLQQEQKLLSTIAVTITALTNGEAAALVEAFPWAAKC